MALKKDEIENKDMSTKPSETKAVKYVGPNDERQLSNGLTFKKGQAVQVEAGLADRLMKNPSKHFQAAG